MPQACARTHVGSSNLPTHHTPRRHNHRRAHLTPLARRRPLLTLTDGCAQDAWRRGGSSSSGNGSGSGSGAIAGMAPEAAAVVGGGHRRQPPTTMAVSTLAVDVQLVDGAAAPNRPRPVVTFVAAALVAATLRHRVLEL